MEGTKFVKARCAVSGKTFGMEVLPVGPRYEVVDMVELTDEQARLLSSEVRQDSFDTHNNLQACLGCGSRRVGGCNCPKRGHACQKGAPYNFQCIYCTEFKIDYSVLSKDKLGQYKDGDWIVTPQGKRVRIITFSNVEWTKYDNVGYHENGSSFGEPKVHVIANEKNIEFHGYNISKMDEGVYYQVEAGQGFSIECDVDTSTISPHPGGFFYVDFGKIRASITQNGGSFTLDGRGVGSVGSHFKMKLVLTEEGVYEVWLNNRKCGDCRDSARRSVVVRFGFNHDSHYCSQLSHAFLRNINMTQG